MRHQRCRPPSDSAGPSCAAVWTTRSLRWFVRPLVELLPDTEAGVRWGRSLVAAFLAVAGPAEVGVRFVAVDDASPGGTRVRGEWALPAGTRTATPDLREGAVLYLHGSAFAVASARTHRGITSRLATATGRPVLACANRLAPTHRFPAAAEDVAATHAWLVAQGVDPRRLVVAGDSAGGHLAVDLAASLRDAGAPTPAGFALFSPLIDLSLTHARRRERTHGPDPMLSAGRAARLLAHHLREADPASPRLRFDATTVRGLGPFLVHAGGAEMLAGDAEHLADLVRAAGGTVHLRLWPGQVHVFQAMSALVPEATEALAEAAAFVRACLDDVAQPRGERHGDALAEVTP
jgi:epsilon-lactone hydrolase